MTHPEDMDLQPAWATEFPLQPQVKYLNHAAIGPWPRRTCDAICAFAQENAHRACSSAGSWLKGEQEARQRLAQLLCVPDNEDLSLLKNTSEGVSLIAAGLSWSRGDKVVLPAGEFPSNRLAWQALAEQGVRVVQVSPDVGEDLTGALIRHCDRHTRLVAVSAVQYDTGEMADLGQLGEYCRDRDILLVVDAIQMLGARAFDAQAIGADFVVGAAHKWLLAPEGVGYMYSRSEARQQLRVQQHGWRMGARPFDFEREDWAPASTGRRFEPGTLNTTGLLGLSASLSLLQEVGLPTIGRCIEDRVTRLIDALHDLPGLTVVTPRLPSRRAGIVALEVTGPGGAPELYRRLKAQGYYTAVRNGLLRISPHFYTPAGVIEGCIAAVTEHS